jgi:hypothetical protein
MPYCKFIPFLLIACFSVAAAAADKPESFGFENAQLQVHLMSRTPNQMAAFYEARGFPKNMVETLKGYCFLTVGIRNKSRDVLWLDVDQWHFVALGGEVERMQRSRWKELWTAMAVPQAAQSTFRWTLLPETLDFRPDEGEGGNVVLKRIDTPFSLTARFATGEDKQGGAIEVRIDGIQCANDEEAK